MKRVELLAPAGSFEALKAAVNYGADAVYLGGTNFSARAFATNFDHEGMIEAVNYCHLRGVKVYVTLNTLLNEKELENAINEAMFYYNNNVDALIIQDLGLYYRLKQLVPDFDLHASTQMHIHNINGVINAKKLGFKKVVLARESSIDLIREACKHDIDIECFVHGAICVSYSGQCLMSSASKNRSANKGMCAQCCRLKYKIIDENTGKTINTDTDYLLSPKDMFLLEDIPELIKAGVSSFKIEGRLKSPEYVGLMTSIYRKAIDSYYEGKEYSLSNEEYQNILSVFNRGFTNSYLKNDSNDIFGNIRPNHIGRKIGEVISFKNGKCLIKLSKSLNQFDGIRILNHKEDFGKILNTLSINGKYVSSANKGDVIEINIDSKVDKGDSVVLTSDHYLNEQINSYKLKKRPISMSVYLHECENIVVSAKLDDIEYTKVFSIQPDKALNAPLNEETIFDQFSKTGDDPFVIDVFKADIGNVFMPKSKLNSIRRDFFEDFKKKILDSFKRNITPGYFYGKISNLSENHTIIENHCDLDVDQHLLKRDEVININGIYQNPDICCEFGNILSNKPNKTAYYTLNVCNSYAYEMLLRLGFSKIILSSELKFDFINDLIEAFNNRNSTSIKPFVLAYGRRALMYLKRNPLVKYTNSNNKLLLFDGINKYRFIDNTNHIELVEYDPHVLENIDLNKVNVFVIIDFFDDIKYIKNTLNISL